MPKEAEYCVSVMDVKKRYKGNVNALNGISFNVEYGKIFGLLGANGAGKTTAVKILATLLHPTSGRVRIFGKDISKHPLEIRRRLGLVLQQPCLEPRLTVRRSLEFYGMYWGIPSKTRKDRIRKLLNIFQLESVTNTISEDLSIGQRRRLQVAREFIHDMDLLFLDEPTVGMDPAARRRLLDHIKNQTKLGLTVILTTHIMEEADYLCDEIAFIDKGKIIAVDTPSGLKQNFAPIKTIEVTFERSVSPSEVLEFQSFMGDQKNVELLDTNTIRIHFKDSQNLMARIVNYFYKRHIQIDNIAITPPTLEQVFLTIISKSEERMRNPAEYE